MSHLADARMLTQRLTALLHRNGIYVVRSGDMRWWADLVESRGGWANPTFLPELCHGPAEFLAAFAAGERGDDFAAAIAWRVLQTDDYVARMRGGTEWAPDAAAIGWPEWDLAAAPRIAGRVHDRGGAFTDPARRHNRLVWYMTGLQWCIAAQDGADFVVSHTLPAITGTQLPRATYGYDRVAIMPPQAFPWHPAPIATAMVWSDAHAIRQEVARRLRYLRQRHADDLRGTAVGYEAYQAAIEGADPVWAAAVDEGHPRPA